MKNTIGIKRMIFFITAVLFAGISFAQNNKQYNGNVYDASDSIANIHKGISAEGKQIAADIQEKKVPENTKPALNEVEESVAAQLAKELNGDTKDEMQKQKNDRIAVICVEEFKKFILKRLNGPYMPAYDYFNLKPGDDFRDAMKGFLAFDYGFLMNGFGYEDKKVADNVLLAYVGDPAQYKEKYGDGMSRVVYTLSRSGSKFYVQQVLMPDDAKEWFPYLASIYVKSELESRLYGKDYILFLYFNKNKYDENGFDSDALIQRLTSEGLL